MANLKDLIVNGSARILGTIYGNLVGNASTATRATQDASGNVITTTYATKSELGTKQSTLISGTNIKTINGESILGSGNMEIKTGSDLDIHPLYND